MSPRGDLLLFPVAEAEGIALASLIRNTANEWISPTRESFVLPKYIPKAKVITTIGTITYAIFQSQ